MHNNTNKTIWASLRVVLVSVALPLFAACGGGGGGGAPPAAATLTSITVTPASATLQINRIVQLVAVGHYSNKTTKDLTATVTWLSSSSATVATPATGVGVATAGSAPVAGDQATVTATDPATLVSGSTTVTLAAPAATFTVGTVNDPLASQQWHLKNTGQSAYADTAGTAGQDINVDTIYNDYGYTGLGVITAVIDSGLEIAHEDLAANVVPNGSWNFNTGTTDPTNTATDGDHGTSVSGLIAMVKGNGKGGIGVAPEASLKGFNFISSSQSQADWLASLGGSTANPDSSDVAVFNQSYGVSTTFPLTEKTTVVNQFIYGVTKLRAGKGALYVKAAGNGFGDMGTGTTNCQAANTLGVSCENANFDPDNVLPYNIVIGALNADGIKSSYSTAGSAIWVSAPGGEYGLNNPPATSLPPEAYEPAMITADQSTCSAGYAQLTNPYYPYVSNFDLGASPNTSCNYTSTFNGTSSATPVTSGVIALLLETNPSLTWRDVKHILASTARQVDAARAPITTPLTGGSYTAEQGWITNKAGYKYHNWYGFGAIDVTAAVNMARSYPYGQLGAFINSGWISSGSLNLAIPDFTASGVTNVITVSKAPATIETIQIKVSATHSYTGDLGIELTSPDGTTSILKNIRDGFAGANLSGMLLETNAFYGESGNGTWTIKVVDGNKTAPSTNNTGGTLTNWQIRIYGH
jgi:subtilisin family serine protease/subtilisin-like proprotein convertase family protein